MAQLPLFRSTLTVTGPRLAAKPSALYRQDFNRGPTGCGKRPVTAAIHHGHAGRDEQGLENCDGQLLANICPKREAVGLEAASIALKVVTKGPTQAEGRFDGGFIARKLRMRNFLQIAPHCRVLEMAADRRSGQYMQSRPQATKVQLRRLERRTGLRGHATKIATMRASVVVRASRPNPNG